MVSHFKSAPVSDHITKSCQIDPWALNAGNLLSFLALSSAEWTLLSPARSYCVRVGGVWYHETTTMGFGDVNTVFTCVMPAPPLRSVKIWGKKSFTQCQAHTCVLVIFHKPLRDGLPTIALSPSPCSAFCSKLQL